MYDQNNQYTNTITETFDRLEALVQSNDVWKVTTGTVNFCRKVCEKAGEHPKVHISADTLEMVFSSGVPITCKENHGDNLTDADVEHCVGLLKTVGVTK